MTQDLEVSRLETEAQEVEFDPRTQLLQRMQDEQGWVVVGCPIPLDMGHVEDMVTGAGGVICTRVVVVGEATQKNLEDQIDKYGLGGFTDFNYYRYFYKVRAE